MPEGILGSTAMEKLLRDRKSGNGNFPNGRNSVKEERGKGGRGGIPGQLHIPGNSWDKPAGNGPDSSREFSKAARNPKKIGNSVRIRVFPGSDAEDPSGSVSSRISGMKESLPAAGGASEFPIPGGSGASSRRFPHSRKFPMRIPTSDPKKSLIPPSGRSFSSRSLGAIPDDFSSLKDTGKPRKSWNYGREKPPGIPNIPARPRLPESTESESHPGTATP